MSFAKSVLVTEFGGYDKLQVTDYPLRDLDVNDVKVEVHYCGLNFADLYTRQGLMPKHNFPFVLGMECSGIITEIGENVEKFKVGNRVICYDYTGGLYRNVVVLDANKCFTIPEYISLQEAAALFVNYLTAHFCLFELGNLKPEQTVFIHSCTGGVGLAATKLSLLQKGVKIIGTCSSEKISKAQNNGVHHVLEYFDYQKNLCKLYPRGVSVFIDNQAGGDWKSNLEFIELFGRIIVTGVNYIIKDTEKLCIQTLQPDLELPMSSLIMNSISVSGLHLGLICEKYPSYVKETFEKICLLFENKKINVVIDSIWKMEDIVEATQVLQSRKNVGKILLKTSNVG